MSQPWFKVETIIRDHPRVIQAGNTAMGIWIRMMATTAAFGDDGFVSDVSVKRIIEDGETKAFQRLIDSGLIERDFKKNEWGYMLFNYSKHNKTREQFEEEIEDHKKAGQKGGTTKSANAKGISAELLNSYKRILKKYPGGMLNASVEKKWVAKCIEHFPTLESLVEFENAVDIYIETYELQKRTYVHKDGEYRIAPLNFIEDKDGEQRWKAFIAAAEEVEEQQKAKQAAVLMNELMYREKLEWDPQPNEDATERAMRERNWPDEEKQKWVEAHLTGKPPEYRDKWLELHGLTGLFSKQEAA